MGYVSNAPGRHTGTGRKTMDLKGHGIAHQTRHDAGAFPIILKGTASDPPGAFPTP